jgi:hypothetical protein
MIWQQFRTPVGRSDPNVVERREDNFPDLPQAHSPARVSAGRGAAETLSAAPGTGRSAVTAGVFFGRLQLMVFENLQIVD